MPAVSSSRHNRSIGSFAAALSLIACATAGAQTITWMPIPVYGPPSRSGTALAYDTSRGTTVLYGGYNSRTGAFNDTWEWNGTVWAQRSVVGPSPRSSHAMAYDESNHVTVLFGGNAPSGYNSETWTWDGNTWTPRQTTLAPAARSRHAMCYDSARAVTVLFGGGTATGNSAETWEWNGSTWTLASSGGPSPRYAHAMTYDASRGVTVLFGGTNGSTTNSETWEWNGTSWTQRNATGPSGRSFHSMAFDSARGVTVLFGGYNAGLYSSDTWEWNGTAWSMRTSRGPAASADGALAFDQARDRIELFGGYNNSFSYYGETWELGLATLVPNTIAFAKTAPLGTSVTLQDVHISCPTDTVTSTSVASCTIEDSTGAMTVFGTNQMIQDLLSAAAGTSGTGNVLASLTGTTSEFMGLTELQNIVSAVPGNRYEAPSVTTVSLFDASVFSPIGETLESKLVLVPGLIFPQSGPFVSGIDYYSGTAYGGVDARVSTEPIAALFNATVGSIPTGRRVWMTGVLSQYIGYRFMPVSIGLCVSITTHPTDFAICPGGTAQFQVTASGTGPFTFQWRKDGSAIDSAANPSAATATLSLPNAQQIDAGGYDCVVGNPCGTVLSNRATLRLCAADFNCDAIVDFFDYLDFVDALTSSASNADFNNDGIIDFFDYLDFLDAFTTGC